MPLGLRGLAECSLIHRAAATCGLPQDSNEWLCRTVGTKKYRPPEMKDGRAAQPPIDIYCFGLMIEKLLRQRQRVSIDGCAARMPPAAPPPRPLPPLAPAHPPPSPQRMAAHASRRISRRLCVGRRPWTRRGAGPSGATRAYCMSSVRDIRRDIRRGICRDVHDGFVAGRRRAVLGA